MFRIAEEVRALIRPGDRVLDVGGAEETFPRADVVLDIVPYEDRRPGPLHGEPERFTAETWHTGDICSPEIWSRFADGEFDFVLCSHTLEDVRDPISVCAEMVRVGRRGYIEVPSRLRECTREDREVALAGWNHHRWIVDFEDGDLIFTAKMQWAHELDYLGYVRSKAHREACILDYRLQFLGLEWEGSFGFVERMAKGPVIETEELVRYFSTFPFRRPPEPVRRVSGTSHAGTFLSHREFQLPVEIGEDPHRLYARYQERLDGARGR